MKFQRDTYKKNVREIHMQTLFLVYEKLFAPPRHFKEGKWSNAIYRL